MVDDLFHTVKSTKRIHTEQTHSSYVLRIMDSYARLHSCSLFPTCFTNANVLSLSLLMLPLYVPFFGSAFILLLLLCLSCYFCSYFSLFVHTKHTFVPNSTRFARHSTHFTHSLENWVQHDLFTIRKYVLWLQQTIDMIIFLCFCCCFFVFIAISVFWHDFIFFFSFFFIPLENFFSIFIFFRFFQSLFFHFFFSADIRKLADFIWWKWNKYKAFKPFITGSSERVENN